MATTGTYLYNPTAAQIITEALKTLGVLEESVSASSAQITDCLPSLEMYLKSMGKYGLELWTIYTESVTLVASTYQYAPTYKFLSITNVVFRDSSNEDTELTGISREEYWNLPNKTNTSSLPTQYYYDPQITAASSTLYIWPGPDSTAATGTLQVTGTLLLEDADTSGDGSATLDIPQEWIETITYGLAVRLAPKYGYPMAQRGILRGEYNEMLKENLSWDTEQTSIYFQPDYLK